MEEFITACPRNCYSTCTFRVQVEENTIKRILPYEMNLATPEGPCIKGISYVERAHSKQRITHPLVRRENGIFDQISLNEAFDLITERLTKTKEAYGPKSILWYKGSGMSGLTNEIGYNFWKEFGGVTTTYGNLCWPAGLEAVRLTLGSVKHNVPWDIENARTIVIWGKNPAETNIQEMSFIGKAKRRGAKVIVIDPRRTTTADKADILYQPKPATDAALALGIAWVLVNKNLIDKEFIAKNVKGFDQYVNSSLINPSDSEQICGIGEKDITDLAEIIGKGSPVTFLPGYGLQRYSNGGQTVRSILSLAVITGNIGKTGSGFNYANLQSYIYDDPKEPLSYFPDKDSDKPFRRIISMAKLGTDLLRADNPPVKFIWVERGNPLLQSPDSSKVSQAFGNSDFNVVVEQFMTDTAKAANIILPAKDIFEQSDIIGSYWSPYVQFKPKILQPEAEVIPETEIYYQLSKRLGMNVSTDLIPEPGNDNIEKWLENRIKGNGFPTLNDLRNGPLLAPGLQQIAYEDLKFETPSGKIELLSEQMEKKWNSQKLPVYTPLSNKADSGNELPLIFISPNTGCRIHSQFGNMQAIIDSVEPPAVEISVKDAATRKIISGDRVKVFNKSGSVESVAKITGRLPEGIIVLPNGIWMDENGGANMLTTGEETDIGFGAAFHGKRVEIEKIL